MGCGGAGGSISSGEFNCSFCLFFF